MQDTPAKRHPLDYWPEVDTAEETKEQYKLSDRLACWEPPSAEGHRITDPFTLMEAIVRGSDNQGRYYADPPLLRRLQWWQDDWDSDRIHGWLRTLVEWGEITVEPLARNCYGGEIHPVLVIQNPRRFRRFAARPSISTKDRVAVYARDNGRCRRCGTTESLSVDHIVAWSKGGAHDLENFQTLCLPCNIRKGNK